MSDAPLLGIAGLGLIGASTGLRASARGWRVAGWDPDGEHAGIALDRGAVHELVPDVAALAARVQTLVIAAPLDATVALLDLLAAGPRPFADLIVDVASVKVPVARAGAPLAAFVATHPIAGSERSGPLAATADLFVGRTWTYDPSRPPHAVARARAFIATMGAVPYALASAEHDRVVALTSHLPQLVSVALGARLAPALGDATVEALCGSGVRSMLRLGASSWPVWRAIIAANGQAIAQEVRTLANVLSMVAVALDDGRSDVLAGDFAASAAAFARLQVGAAGTNAGGTAPTSTDERDTWIDGSHAEPH
ncbi:MAG: hypothetical protein NVSMB19_04150 [Vulcanimicrobiaceae bacterium]